MRTESAAKQLSRFMSRYDPEVVRVANGALRKLRALMPGATELVYDNYNALVVGFGPSDRASEAIVSIALYPRWVNLFFLDGAKLKDPKRILKGAGSRVRRILLKEAADIDQPDVKALIAAAMARADPPIDATAKRTLIIKSISAKQRPRR